MTELTDEDFAEVDSFLDWMDDLRAAAVRGSDRTVNAAKVESGIGTICDLIENNPAKPLILQISRRGYMTAVRLELQRRIEERRKIERDTRNALLAEHASAARKSMLEKKRAVQIMREGWGEASQEEFGPFPSGQSYSDLFWGCGTPKYSLDGARPLPRDMRELTALDPVAVNKALIDHDRGGLR